MDPRRQLDDLAGENLLRTLTPGESRNLRITRGGMLDVLNQDFIRTARAKGASELRIVIRHGLRGVIAQLEAGTSVTRSLDEEAARL